MFISRMRPIYALIGLLTVGVLLYGSFYALASNSSSNVDHKRRSIMELSAEAAVLEVSSNRHTQPEKNQVVKNRLTLDGFTKILENDSLEIWHKDVNASIRIVDKYTGYIWGGLDSDKPEDMNTTWAGIGNALVSIDYFDNKGLERRISIADEQVDKYYNIDGNKLIYSVNFKKLGIAFDFEMELSEDNITFRMIDDSIKEEGTNLLAAVYFVPFLGCTRGDEIDGYMFIPDGPGALIRFKKPSQYLINFNKRIYGKDYGIDDLKEVNDLKATRPNDFLVEEPTVLMPVYGVVHGVRQNAFFAIIEEGAEYASIMATPSGVLTNYNWVTAKFIYRQKYTQPTSKSGAGVQVAQKERNRFKAEVSFRFLHGEDADYVGMAKLYRELLQKRGELPSKTNVPNGESIPLQLDIIGADIQKGFIFNDVLVITPIEMMENIINELSKKNIKNILMVIKGWQKGGLNGTKPSDVSFEKKLGGLEDFLRLSKAVEFAGGKLLFYENPVTVNETQIDLREEGGHSLSQALIRLERDNRDLWFKDTYFVESNLVADYIMKKATIYKNYGLTGMAIDEVGAKLYAENQRGNVTTRLEAKNLFEQAVKRAAEVGELALYRPNQYLWKYADKILNVPMVNSQYLFETDTVPFLQIVLKGSVDYFAPYSNMSFYSRIDVLKLIEYGAYPSFLLTGMSNYELEHTAISELSSTAYEDWKQHIIDIYHEVNGVLSKVIGKKIVDRQILAQGVVEVIYEDNLSVIVNYTGSDFHYGETTVPAFGYTILRGDSDGSKQN